ncbi:MAG TPA: hypothetical protein VGK38_06375 [Prolixibacteraceae bacterium]|jgi:hypothetical protein
MDVKVSLIALVFVVFADAGLMIKYQFARGVNFLEALAEVVKGKSVRFAILKTPIIVPLKFILIKPVRKIDRSNEN